MLSTDYTKYIRSGFELGKGKKLFQANERVFLNQIFYNHSVTQKKIIITTKTPQQTASRLINGLIDKGAIEQVERKPDGSRGQPGYCLEPKADFAYCVGVSIQTDFIAVAMIDFKGEIVAEKKESLGDLSIENGLKHIRLLMNEIIAENNINEEKIFGLGLGISGYFSAQDGKINTMLDQWTEIDIAAIMADSLQLPVWVENDGKAAAAGEGIAGAGQRYRDFVYLYLATGFAGGVIVNGELLRGAHDNAGELGELLPSKIYSHPNLELLRQVLIRNGVDISTVSELIEKFDINWPGISEWVMKVKDSLSLVASACAALLDTKAIIIGGPIPKELAEILVGEISVYAQNRRSLPRYLPDLVVAEVEGDPVSIGAATLPFRECFL